MFKKIYSKIITMVEALVGTWRLEASENFEEFLQALGNQIRLFKKIY